MRFKCTVLHPVPHCFLTVITLCVEIPSAPITQHLQLEVSSSSVLTEAVDDLHVLAERLAIFT